MAEKKVQEQSLLLGFLSKESSESRVDHSKKEGKALAKKDYEKKKQRKTPFPWLATDESGGKMYCLYCRENEAFADKRSSLFAGCCQSLHNY